MPTTPSSEVLPSDSDPAQAAYPAEVSVTPARLLERPTGVGTRIVWPYLVAFALLHAALPLTFVPWLFSWSGLLLVFVLHFLFDWLGIGLCFHRALTHGGLVLPKWLERTFVVFGICTLMDSPGRWVAIHRKHHQHTDDRPDPHSPWVSFWWGHMGWLVHQNDETVHVDFYHRYAPDILKDRFYLNLERNNRWLNIYLLHAAIIYLAGMATGWMSTGTLAGALQLGLSWLLWGVVIRTLFTWHATFAVNSVCHLWGYRNYATRENSTNHWLVALLTGGEGWHNNHHAYPVSAAHGHKWWEWDPTYRIIRALEAVGLAKQVKTFRDAEP